MGSSKSENIRGGEVGDVRSGIRGRRSKVS